MSATFVENLSQLDVTELRQLIIALCLDPKTKEFATQHLDMTAHMKLINAREAPVSEEKNSTQGAQVSYEENATHHDSEPCEKGSFDWWYSPSPTGSDSEAEHTPCSTENGGWEAGGDWSDAWGEENQSTYSLSPDPVEDDAWGLAPEPGLRSPTCERDNNTWGSSAASECSASERATKIDGGGEFTEEMRCADCDEEFIPTSKWYGESYGERMPCRFHPGRAELDAEEFNRVYGPEEPRATCYSMINPSREYPHAYVWTCCNKTVAEASPCQPRDWHTTATR